MKETNEKKNPQYNFMSQKSQLRMIFLFQMKWKSNKDMISYSSREFEKI